MNTLEQVEKLLTAQKEQWPQAAANYAALANVEVKELPLPGMNFKVQFNPARIASTGAKVDVAAIKARKCFLCAANRPEVQKGIDWNDRYTILVNPFPIFPRHLTIPDKEHTLQLIKGRMTHMMQLAAELPGYTVFYNGPRCGASAPDHMHFQAGNSDFLTIWDAAEAAVLTPLGTASSGQSALSASYDTPLHFFVIDAANPADGEELFDRLYNAMPVPEGEQEPMMKRALPCTSRPHTRSRDTSQAPPPIVLWRRRRLHARKPGFGRPRRCAHHSAQSRFRPARP